MIKIKNYSKIINYNKIENIIELNTEVINGKSSEIIKLAEKDHEKRLDDLVKKIIGNNELKIILISGPSSSGKTTFAQKLERKLYEKRRKSIIISMDNYFKDIGDTPIGIDGKPDYESLYTLEIELFQNQINDLINKKYICMPHYDFKKGRKIYDNNYLKLKNNEFIIIEGIHAFNPKVLQNIDSKYKFKIFVVPIINLKEDTKNIKNISSKDTRLIRRIVRDVSSRGVTVEKTLELWPKVIKAEENNIFKYVNTANYIYNTSLVYELGVIKEFALKQLSNIDELSIYYNEVKRLNELLNKFKKIETQNIPNNSIIREFIGNGCFYR